MLRTLSSPILQDYKLMIEEATRKYQEMVLENTWKPTTKRGSHFNTAFSSDVSTMQTQTSHKNTASSNNVKSNKNNNIDCTPPKRGDARTKQVGNRTVHWCGNTFCQRWGSHLTENHEKWREERQSFYKNKKHGGRSGGRGNNNGCGRGNNGRGGRGGGINDNNVDTTTTNNNTSNRLTQPAITPTNNNVTIDTMTRIDTYEDF